jgi:hypothetical protein
VANMTLPLLDEVRTYMEASGWRECPPGVAGSLWLRDDRRIGVPAADIVEPDSILGVIERLAAAEGLSTQKLATRIRYFKVDVTYLRAVNNYRIVDSIPLETASAITTSARIMLRSSGTTAIKERGEIGGNYSPRGDQVVHDSQMAHTTNGSFVIPILVRLPDVIEPELSQEPLVEIERSAPEPFERRVVRTLAQSMSAVRTYVVEPAREPTLQTLHAAVERGVTREFCTSLARILNERVIGEFEASFEWAPAIQISDAVPRSVMIEAEAQPLIEKAAELLRVIKIEPKQTFSGKIVELRHDVGDAFGWVTVSTMRHGRMCEIRVRLRLDHYNEAVVWHRDARPVLVEGPVRRSYARRLLVDAPVRCHPVDEAYLT